VFNIFAGVESSLLMFSIFFTADDKYKNVLHPRSLQEKGKPPYFILAYERS
jgi:hypothetical protein